MVSLRRLAAWAFRRPYLFLIALFVAVHLLALAIGCRFDAGNLSGWIQIADLPLLRDHLLRTLWYLHSQPPLFNLIIGLGLKLGDAAFPWAIGLLYAAVTLGGILTFHALVRDLTLRPKLALAMAAWLCISPAVLLFSQKLYYDSLVPWLFCMAFWGLHSGTKNRSFGRLLFGFAMASLVVLLRSMIHPIVFLMIASVYVLQARGQRWSIVAAAAGPAAVIGLLLLKNFMVFGFVGLSSWAPLNLAHTTIDRLSPDLRNRLIAEGRLPPVAAIEAFAPPENYLKFLPPIPRTGEPSLDDLKKSSGFANLNHIVFTRLGRDRLHDCLTAVAANPGDFAKVLATSLYHFHRPASEFKGLELNLAHIAWWDRIANATIGLQPVAWFGSSLDPNRPAAPLLQISWSLLLLSLGFGGAALRLAYGFVQDVRHSVWPPVEQATITAMVLTGSFVILVSSSFDVWENNRAHFAIGPVLMVAALWFAFARKGQPR